MKRRRGAGLAYLLILPSLVLIFILVLYPLCEALWLSFHQRNLLRPGLGFVGLKNFISIFSQRQYWIDLKQTVTWTVGSVMSQHILALIIALLLNHNIRLKSVFRAVFLLPWVCPVVVFALLWQWLYSDLYGVLNYALIHIIGITREPIIWLGSRKTAMGACILANTWKEFALPMIVILARLQTIPQELYEAAKMDGASAWQNFRFITFPFLERPIAITILITSIWTFNNFGTMYLLTGGGPSKATETLAIYTYLTVFADLKIGVGAAISTTMTLMLFVMWIIYLKLIKFREDVAT
jgi:multiple sugar transport system permease protein